MGVGVESGSARHDLGRLLVDLNLGHILLVEDVREWQLEKTDLGEVARRSLPRRVLVDGNEDWRRKCERMRRRIGSSKYVNTTTLNNSVKTSGIQPLFARKPASHARYAIGLATARNLRAPGPG